MKSFLNHVVYFIFILIFSIPSYAYDFEVDGLYYNITSFTDLTCELACGKNGDVVIPPEVTYNSRNLKVTSIGSEAFKRCSSLTSITIPNSVTSIRDNAFYSCSSLTSITIPNSVTSIGNLVFEGCSSLTSITIPNSVTSIGSRAFEGCGSLISITIPNSVTSIGDYTFKDCTSLSSITIPNSVTSLGKSVFERCWSLTSITIPNSVTSIGDCTFKDCASLEYIQLSNNLKSIEYGLFYGCYKLKCLDIPGSVEKICQRRISTSSDMDIEATFYSCSSLSRLSIMQSSQSLIIGYMTYDGYWKSSYSWESWTENIKELYIDRKLESYIPVPNLVKLEIGESIQKIPVSSISSISTLDTIYSYAKVPPTLPSMTNKHYINTIVKVPADALEAYKNANNWKNFWNLSAMESSGINDIQNESKTEIIGRYDLNGNRVDENYNGITIVKFSDGSTRKMINKSN